MRDGLGIPPLPANVTSVSSSTLMHDGADGHTSRRSVGSSLVWVAAVALLTWPGMNVLPLPGFEQSWGAALHMAVYHHVHFGSEIVFNYGPLGFLSNPTLHSTPTAVLAWIFGAIVHVVLTTAVFIALRRWLRPIVAVAVSFLVMGLALLEPSERLVMVAFFIAAAWIEDAIPVRWEPVAGPVLGVLAGVELLVKFNTGIYVLVFAVIAALVQPRRQRALAGAAVAMIATTAVIWLAIGEPIRDLGTFISRSLAIANGYTAALMLEEPGRHREYWWAVIVVAVVFGTIIVCRPTDRRRWLGLSALILAFTYLEFRRGFVRHDGHSFAFFLGGVLVPVVARWPRKLAPIGLFAVGVTAMMMAGAVGRTTARSALTPSASLRGLRSQATTLFVPDRRSKARAIGVDAIRRADPMSPDVVNAVRGPVHVDPWEVAAAWAYGFRWQPVPVMQTYSAFTPKLDRVNAAALIARGGPRTVLRPTHPGAIDGRHPAFESPDYMVTMVCHFRIVAEDPNWQVLRRTANRCGAPRHLSTQTLLPGTRVKVPAGDSQSLIVARFSLPRTFLDAFREMVFKPAHIVLFDDDKVIVRFIVGTAPDRHLLRIPSSYPLASGEGDFNLSVDNFGLHGIRTGARVTFEAIPFRP